MAFKVGDVVWLKSGGARMVVSETGLNDSLVGVTWQNTTKGNHVEQTATYKEDMLTTTNPSGGLVGRASRG